MRRIILLLTVVILLIPAPANAQGSRLYRLRPVSAEDYIQAIEAIKDGDQQSNIDALNLIHDFMRRYLMPDPTVSFTDLIRIFPKIYDPMITPSSELAVWNSALIGAWLKARPIDLDKTTQFDFYIPHFPRSLDESSQYHIVAIPRDFKGDGSPQWLLTISVEENFGFGNFKNVNYLFATWDSDDRYRVYPFPMPWTGFYGSVWEDSNTTLHLLYFQDLTGEGHSEFVFSADPFGYYETGTYYVLAWQNGQIVDLTRTAASTDYGIGAYPLVGSVIMLSPSQVPHIYNILIQTPQTDNWGCLHTETQIVGWNRMQWVLAESMSAYANTAGCQWRKAESAMWQGDYPTAIAKYQAGLLKMVTDPVKPNPEMVQYIQIRLTLAFMLNGQSLQASVLSTALKLQTPDSEIIRQLINDLPLRPVDNPYPICANVRNVFQKFLDRGSYDAAENQIPVLDFILRCRWELL